MSFTGSRAVCRYTHTVDAPPRDVFPLLCPIREREWIPGWRGEAVYSASGVAEPDGIFVAGLEGAPRATFFVTRFEAPRAIEYLILAGDGVADRLGIALEDRGDGTTTLTWHRVYTGLTPDGSARVEAAARAFEARVPELAARLGQHLRSR
jgi:hypothetical protein